MAKKIFSVTIKNTKSVFNVIEKALSESVQDSLFNKIEKYSVTRIQQQTRLGKDLVNKGVQPNLSKSYIKLRERVAAGKIGRVSTSKFFEPDRSNLTLSGQLLDSVFAKTNQGAKTVTIGVSGVRKPTGLEKYFKNSKSIKTNAELAKDLESRGRFFLGLDVMGVQQIRRFALEEIRRRLKSRVRVTV